jgi:hypothetical protein
VFGANEAFVVGRVGVVAGKMYPDLPIRCTRAQFALFWGLARTARRRWYLPSRDCGSDVMEFFG